MSTNASTSVIHDIGYKPYTGPRLGHAQIVRGLYVHSLRSVFGIGRGAKAKVVPFAVLAIMLFPAVLNVYTASKNEALALSYALLANRMFLFSVVFVAVAAPELVSRDLRHHTLPLYFSRPLRRADYPLAKLLALISAVLLVQLLPILVTYLGQVASATSGHEIWLDSRDAFPGLFVGVLYAVLFSTIALLLASSTGRRVIATGIIAIFFLVATAISSVLQDALGTTWAHHTTTCTVPTITAAQAKAHDGPVFGDGPDENSALIIDQLCPGVTLRLDNIDDVRVSPAAQTGYAIESLTYETPVYSMVAKAGGMADPVTIIEGTRIWVFDATDSDVPNPSPLGPAYAAELAVLALATGGGLFLRYRKVSVS